MSSIVSIDTRGYDISMGPGVLRVGGGGGLAGNVYINGNVGIGTANPTARLHVNGKISSNAEISVGGTPNAGNSGGYRLLRLTPVSGTATQITFDTSISTGTGQNYIYSDNTIMEIKSPLTNFTGGSVGIGTSTPSRLLDVRGDAQIGVSTNKCIEIISGTTDLTYINFHSKDVSYNNYDTRITSTGGSTSGQTQRGNLLYSALNHAFNTGGTDKMTITSTGSVGIGTTSPAATLDVAGSVRAYNLPVGYHAPNAGGSISWVRLGVFTVSDQTGQMCIIKLYGETGYNANIDQSNTTTIFFKVGNGQSGSGLNPTGFAGDCYYYTEGKTTSLEAAPIWISNQAGLNARTFTLFIRLNAYNTNAFYTVERDQSGTSSWTHSYSFGTAPATTPSSTCLVSTQQYAILAPNIYLSGSTYRTPYIYASGSAIFTPTTASGTLKLLDNITIPAAYSTTQPIMYVSNGDLLANAAIIVSGYYSSQVTPIHAGVSYINSPLTATRINYMLVLP